MRRIECDTAPCYYHGSEAPLTHLNQSRLNDDNVGLCLSASVNIARRYGPFVSRFVLERAVLQELSIQEWMGGRAAAEASEGIDGLLVCGDRSIYDFQADMLAVTNLSVLKFDRVLTTAELEQLDDGFSALHEPTGPSSRGWAEFVADRCSGDLNGALADIGWEVVGERVYAVLERDDGHREYRACVFQVEGCCMPLELEGMPEKSWAITDDMGAAAGGWATKDEALAIADQWLQQQRAEREAIRRPSWTRPCVEPQPVAENDDPDVPF
jgi:hypothetical protein